MDLNKMQKFKIYEIYKNKTILFYIIVLFYTEMVTGFCSSYFIFLSDKSMPSFGDPGKFAGALGVLMAVFGFTMPCKAAEALADFLNQKFSLFEII